MTTVLLSPSERELSHILGGNAVTSPIPEEKGADALLYTKHGLFGIQRKAVPHDFISSIQDGRMARSTTLLKELCQFRLLLCEGRFRFYPDGKLDMGLRVPTRYTYRHVRGMLFDIRYVKNVEVDWTEDVHDTADYILTLAEFFSKEKHLGLYTRPSVKGVWGVPTKHDLGLWLLQSFSGIGPTIADNIIEHFGGRIPLRWSCAARELAQVRGLGRKRAEEMWGSLGGEAQSQEASLQEASLFDSLRRDLRGE